MIDNKKSEICIIGAGIGGLTAGALLTKHGYKVTIFEKESLIGGRALSFDDLSLLTIEKYKEWLLRSLRPLNWREETLTICAIRMLLCCW